MKSIYELQQICLQSRKEQDELFETDLKYFIKNIEKQIEENAEKVLILLHFILAMESVIFGKNILSTLDFEM